MEEYNLEVDEVIIFKEDNVSHCDTLIAPYVHELVLTNKKVIFVEKGVLGNTKEVYLYPLTQIKVYNGVPQVRKGRTSRGIVCLDIYFLSCEEHFSFNLGRNKNIPVWVAEINRLLGTTQNVVESKDKSKTTSLKNTFKEAGQNVTGMFGIKCEKHNNGNVTEQTTAPSLQIIICKNCGKKLPGIMKFCTECGSPVEIAIDLTDTNLVEKSNFSDDETEKMNIERQIELVEKIKKLADEGALSQEEFIKLKNAIL